MFDNDEVLQGLKCHGNISGNCGSDCPYYEYFINNSGCSVRLARDAAKVLNNYISTTEESEIKPTKSSQKIIDIADQLGLIAPEYWCGNCGYNLINHPKYCENCGKKVKWDD